MARRTAGSTSVGPGARRIGAWRPGVCAWISFVIDIVGVEVDSVKSIKTQARVCVLQMEVDVVAERG